ncbi:MAG: hypothetical protein ACTSWN_17185 [Promethearchaeota archaeon]
MSIEKQHLVGVTILFSGSLANLIISSFYLGWVLSKIQDEDYIIALLLGLVAPAAVIVVANLGEKIKKIVLFAYGCANIISNYFVLMGGPNFPVPNISLDDTTKAMYFLSIGASAGIFMIALSDISRLTLNLKAHWHVMFAGLGIAGFASALIIYFGTRGWLYPVMLSNYLIPISLMIYYVFYPGSLESILIGIQDPKILTNLRVKDKTKGMKLTFFTIYTFILLFLIITMNNVLQSATNLIEVGWIFWLFIGIGGAIASVFIWKVINAQFTRDASVEKELFIEKHWLGFTVIQSAMIFVVFSLEFFLVGYHDSIASHIIDGAIFGSIIAIFIYVVALQHPPRSLRAYFLFFGYFLAITIILSNVMKAVNLGVENMTGILEYAYYIVAIILLILILLVISQIITIARKSGKREEKIVVEREKTGDDKEKE